MRGTSNLCSNPAPRGVLALLAALGCAAALTGCSSTMKDFQGKVIYGPSSAILLADAKDERFAEQGVEGAKVELRLRSSSSTRVASTALTKANGDFSMPSADIKAVADQLHLAVSKDGALPAKGDVFIPGADRRVLVILKQLNESSARSAAK